MQARRIYPDGTGSMTLQPGEYGKVGGVWWVHPPHPDASVVPLADESRVMEHEDGTISVHGTINAPGWRGRLEHGRWRPGETDG